MCRSYSAREAVSTRATVVRSEPAWSAAAGGRGRVRWDPRPLRRPAPMLTPCSTKEEGVAARPVLVEHGSAGSGGYPASPSPPTGLRWRSVAITHQHDAYTARRSRSRQTLAVQRSSPTLASSATGVKPYYQHVGAGQPRGLTEPPRASVPRRQAVACRLRCGE